MKIITRRSELAEFAEDLALPYDWHRTGLTVRCEGAAFNNVGNWPTWDSAYPNHIEQHVILSVVLDHDDHTCDGTDSCGCDLGPVDAAAINLATLLAWASGTLTT